MKVKDRELKERIQLAREGKYLKTLSKDPSYRVRVEVAKHGYELDKLCDDKSKAVRDAVENYNNEHCKDAEGNEVNLSELFDKAPRAIGIKTDKIKPENVKVSLGRSKSNRDSKKDNKDADKKECKSRKKRKVVDKSDRKKKKDCKCNSSSNTDTGSCTTGSGHCKDCKCGKKGTASTSKRNNHKRVGKSKYDREAIKSIAEDKNRKEDKGSIKSDSLSVNKNIDIAISFDTTGSMYPVLSEVRNKLSILVDRCFKEIDGVRIAIIAHGDYCDKDNPYTIRILDFTRDEESIKKFINNTAATYGGDSDECYELVLNQANNTLSWRDDSSKILVMVGDANPHGINYPMNKDKLDWVKECNSLKDKGIPIISVHALANYRNHSFDFYNKMADITGGKYLTLNNFCDITSLIVAICYNKYSEEKLSEYVTIIRENGRLSRSLAENIQRMSGLEIEESRSCSSIAGHGLIPVKDGRFQVMQVYEAEELRGFINRNGIKFKTGKTFYMLSKTETVQQYKEVIIQDKKSGEYFTGSKVREMLGLLPQCERSGSYGKEKIRPNKDDDYNIFIQSTSYNRKLTPGTNILYEVADWDSVA